MAEKHDERRLIAEAEWRLALANIYCQTVCRRLTFDDPALADNGARREEAGRARARHSTKEAVRRIRAKWSNERSLKRLVKKVVE